MPQLPYQFISPQVELEDTRRDIPKSRRSISCLTNEEPEYMRSKIVLEDGGTTENNPAYLAFKYARSLLRILGEKIEDYQFQVVSIGTGTETGKGCDPSVLERNWTKPSGSYATTIQRFLFGDVFRITMRSYEVHNRLVTKLGGEGPGTNYMRAQFKVTKHQLMRRDDVSKKNIQSLIESVEKYIYLDSSKQSYSKHFQGIIDLLKQENVIRPPKPDCSRIDEYRTKEMPENVMGTNPNNPNNIKIDVEDRNGRQLEG